MSGLYVEYPSGGSGTTSVGSYANLAAFPNPPPTGMYLAVAQDTDTLYVYDDNLSTWLAVGGTAVPLAVGVLDAAAPSVNGATIGSNSLYMQTAGATTPGLVSDTAQTFGGNKAFTGNITAGAFSWDTAGKVLTINGNSTSNMLNLLSDSGGLEGGLNLGTQPTFFQIQGTRSDLLNVQDLKINWQGGQLYLGSAQQTITFINYGLGPLRTISGGVVDVGSISLASEVSGLLPLSQTIGSLSLTDRVSGALPLSQTSGSISLVNQVSGSLPLSQTSGSLSLASRVSGLLPTQQVYGSVSATFYVANGSQSYAQGTMFYDNVNQSPTFLNNVASISMQIGQENWVRVYNNSSADILNGRAVFFNGNAPAVLGGNSPTVALAQSNTSSTSQLAGIATHDIGNGQFGYVTQFGKVNGIDTSAYSAGQRVWLSASSAGFFQVTEPQSPNFNVFVGYVLDVNASTGSLFVPSIRFGALNPTNTFSSFVLGSITFSQTAGGVRYPVQMPQNPGAATAALTFGSGGAMAWTAILTNPMTTSGDIVVGSASGVAARLPAGAEGSVLTTRLNGTAGRQSWEYVDGPVSTVKTASYVIGSSDGALLCASSSFFLTLPPPATCVGQTFRITKIDANVVGPIVLNTAASQSISLGVGALTSIQLNGAQDFAEVQAINSGSYALLANKITAYAAFNTTAGYGSVQLNIRTFVNTTSNVGNAFTAVTGSGTNGASVTINIPGTYAFTFNDSWNANSLGGLSLNTGSTASAITTIAPGGVFVMTEAGAANQAAACSWTGPLRVGDIVRPHCQATPEGTVPSRNHFSVTRVGD